MSSHLDTIDSEVWPGVAHVARPAFAKIRTRRAETDFAKATSVAELVLEGKNPDLVVVHEELFTRLAANGWVGLAESYMAGEWTTANSAQLVAVLKKLILSNYSPKTPDIPQAEDTGEELPENLVRLYAGDGISHQPGIFATGVPTTVRESVESFVPGSKTHFVDITTLSPPFSVDRDDLGSGQVRAAEWLLDNGRVGAGSHVLIYPATGAQAAVQAAPRRAVVDILTADPDTAATLPEYLVLEGAMDNVAVQQIDSAIPTVKDWRGRYDCIISVDKYSILSTAQRRLFLQCVDRLLSPNGRAVMQLPVATEKMTHSGRNALKALRAYIWPGFGLPTVDEVHKEIEKSSNLRVVAQVHTGAHALESVSQQRSFFDGRLREAAAAGFDPVYRRLWTYQFALREALLSAEMTDVVQFTAVRRHRGGRR